uniref:Terminase n=1 Tax=viral metagenome TaxID=1070528 RepID=A0A6M3KSW8_9ZZZZ
MVRDELARHEYARDNFRAVARSGAKLIELSTANKAPSPNTQNDYFGEKTSEFYYDPATVKDVLPSGLELYTNEKKPGQCLVFLSWNLRPTRMEGLTLTEWWDSRVIPRYTPLEIEEQFPREITDVFKASLVRAFFEMQALEDMGFDVCPPKRFDELNTFNGVVRYYKAPIVGRKYVVFTDPSDGVEDPFVTGVMDFVTGEVVASATGKEHVDRVGEIHDYLVNTYGKASNSYEYTGSVGGVLSMVLDGLKTPNQAPRRKADGSIDKDKKGQWVSEQHKTKTLGDLAFAIAKKQIVVHDREFMQQAKLVTRNGDKPVTSRNLAFDWVLMMAGLWQLQKYVPTSEMKIFSVHY